VTRILPWLVSWAAGGVMIVMIAATVLHLVRAEFSAAATTFLLLAVATFIAYGRWRVAPIRPRKATT
jgi:hypothetical protein